MSPDQARGSRGVTTITAEAAVVAELFAHSREPGTSPMQLGVHSDACGVPTRLGAPR
ncbi:hypothetical protein [Microvirga arabica]|uniref:hypothetical protein n=1 Tax=Microvirga arabica TaxID=1128671 RepID=UPI001939ADD0|nr:hypothetical protein [Microvirga arabica]MBM1174475.1 hypothetical protein [Microvirga arabica]